MLYCTKENKYQANCWESAAFRDAGLQYCLQDTIHFVTTIESELNKSMLAICFIGYRPKSNNRIYLLYYKLFSTSEQGMFLIFSTNVFSI